MLRQYYLNSCKKYESSLWTGFKWHMTCGGLLGTHQWTCGLYKEQKVVDFFINWAIISFLWTSASYYFNKEHGLLVCKALQIKNLNVMEEVYSLHLQREMAVNQVRKAANIVEDECDMFLLNIRLSRITWRCNPETHLQNHSYKNLRSNVIF